MQQPGREKTKKEQFLDNLAGFLQKNRIFFLSFLIAIALFFIVFAIASEIRNRRIEESTIMAEELQKQYEDWSENMDKEEAEQPADIGETAKELISQADSILEKYPNLYAAQRAHYIKANVYYKKGEWSSAAEAFITLQERFPKSYLAPIALHIAAIASEEMDEIDRALELHNQILSNYASTYPDTPRSIFTIGRLYEDKGQYEEAKKQYNTLINEYTPSNWTNLARDRIIYLQSKGLISL